MRSKVFIIWAGIRWLLLMLLVAPALEAPLIAYSSEPAKPLRVWEGVASWYGPRFDGRRTASGQNFDMRAATAAHPTLPFGSLVRVICPKTGRSQLVRINDRGPFVEDREIDVSYAVARRLGIERRGVARVRIELLEVPQRN